MCIVKYAHLCGISSEAERGLLNSRVKGSIPLYRTIFMKYWITDLNKTSVKSPYKVRFTLVNKPNNEEEILKWLETTFGKGGFIVKIIGQQFMYAEIFFKDENDSTSFILRWGDSLV